MALLEHDIGGKLRALRKTRRLTLQGLAKKLKMTASYISRLERNLCRPSLPSLQSLAGIFDVDIATFFERRVSESRPKRVLSPADRIEVIAHGGNLRIKPLANTLFKRPMLEVTEVTLKKGGAAVFPTRPGECLIIMREGKISLVLGQERFRLNPGDSIYYTTEQYRKITNLGGKDAVYISVLYPPVYFK